ncbi:SpoIIE family protein phosphatase [Streptomyces sp. NPDC005012]|uniref:ATP-binding SpoIIE family protein phosphatase n=1 Tax=Streptomyces sp. NPDC005012 TaxID=3154558 RepID=UPI0033A23510
MRREESAAACGRPVVFLLDEEGTVVRCTGAVDDLLGLGAEQVEGRPLADLCVTAPTGGWGRRAGRGAASLVLRHRDGTRVEAEAEVAPLPAGGPPGHLVLIGPGTGVRRDQALVRGFFEQNGVGLVVRGADAPERLLLGPGFFGLDRPLGGGPYEGRLEDALVAEDAARIGTWLRQVLETGEPPAEREFLARWAGLPERERSVSASAFRLEDADGRVLGAAAVLTDVTERNAAERELSLLHSSAYRLGRSLDVTRTAEDVVRLLVTDFADLACLDVTDRARRGDEAGSFAPGTPLRRVAVASSDGVWPPELHQLGDPVRARSLETDTVGRGGTQVVPDLDRLRRHPDVDEERRRLLLPAAASSALFVPLVARGHVLGVLSAWRRSDRLPFGEGDVPLIDSIASRAALNLETARRYTRERRTVEELQRSLLPPPVRRTTAAHSSGVYAPASSAAGTGGSWYDVIRLSGARTAFVIGRVAGHGVHAAGAMGRLRSAVQTLADVDLPPEELLGHLNDLVSRMGKDEGDRPASTAGSLYGATCVYATYDPIGGVCCMASAGHPAPLVGRRGTGEVTQAGLEPGPALGSGAKQPFEPVRFLLDPGDVLAFHSGTSTGPSPAGAGDLGHLVESARAAARSDIPVAVLTAPLLRRLRSRPRAEDVALLLARVDRVPPTRTAHWELSAEPGEVNHARALASAQLTAWGLEELVFSTELVVSELVTNALRHAGGPIGLRLIKDERLICEVSDPSQSQPHLRRARASDEGGRGLFLVAQMTDRWGSRYTADGKTIWTEQVYGEDAADAADD